MSDDAQKLRQVAKKFVPRAELETLRAENTRLREALGNIRGFPHHYCAVEDCDCTAVILSIAVAALSSTEPQPVAEPAPAASTRDAALEEAARVLDGSSYDVFCAGQNHPVDLAPFAQRIRALKSQPTPAAERTWTKQDILDVLAHASFRDRHVGDVVEVNDLLEGLGIRLPRERAALKGEGRKAPEVKP